MKHILRYQILPGMFREDCFIGPFATREAADHHAFWNNRSIPAGWTITGRETFPELVAQTVTDEEFTALQRASAARRGEAA